PACLVGRNGWISETVNNLASQRPGVPVVACHSVEKFLLRLLPSAGVNPNVFLGPTAKTKEALKAGREHFPKFSDSGFVLGNLPEDLVSGEGFGSHWAISISGES